MSDFATLAAAHCQPRKGGEHRLERTRIDVLLTHLPGWAVTESGDAIGKTFAFADYHATIAFVNALAWIAHHEDHHPDLSIHYGRAVVRYSTHDVGGISDNDIICAAKVEGLLR
ncbi:MAG: 4a-hydroxytetrahydrobiopterin dehydratase [Luteimonas sp.]